MSNLIETSLVIRKETIYDKIRKSLWFIIFKKDYKMIQRLDNLIMPKRPAIETKIIIPKEIGKNIQKYKG